MKKIIVCSVVAGVMLFGGLQTASAINCEQVRKYLKTGRTPDEIAETMVVDVDEVKKCAEGGEKAAPQPTPAAK